MTSAANQPADSKAGTATEPQGSAKAPDLLDLPSGTELTEVDAASLSAARPTRLVVVAGPVGCGKTTLLTSLYELFQWRSIPGYRFAGCNSFPAFEQRCDLARAASENMVPDTKRTPYKDPEYLHLRICPATGPLRPVDFLFTDVSGEMFEHARDSTTECQTLSFLRRADHFVLLLDGEKGVRREKRWGMAQNAIALLRSCVDSQMLQGYCVVKVVWAKFDYFEAATDKQEQTTFREQVESEFKALFGTSLMHLRFGEIATRPTEARHLGFGHGVAKMLNEWATLCPRERPMDLLPRDSTGTRESELFAARYFASVKEPQ
jgi:energy-coupling factor transporter ATP-binding protein EcfA2